MRSSLKGRRIVKTEIDADKTVVCLTDEDGNRHWLTAVGASEPDLLPDANKKIADADESELIQIYSVMFATDRGHAELELRNSSNGYYGGRVTYSDECPLDQYRDRMPRTQMRPIDGDF
mgnify:CR=1 FL=1